MAAAVELTALVVGELPSGVLPRGGSGPRKDHRAAHDWPGPALPHGPGHTILLYSWCTEACGTADLQDARALLYALAW